MTSKQYASNIFYNIFLPDLLSCIIPNVSPSLSHAKPVHNLEER